MGQQRTGSGQGRAGMAQKTAGMAQERYNTVQDSGEGWYGQQMAGMDKSEKSRAAIG